MAVAFTLPQVRLPPLVIISVPPGPLSPITTWSANAALVTVQGIAPTTLKITLVTLPGATKPVQLVFSFHLPVTEGLAAGFQTVSVGGGCVGGIAKSVVLPTFALL